MRELFGDKCADTIGEEASAKEKKKILERFERMPAGSILPVLIPAGGSALRVGADCVAVFCEALSDPSFKKEVLDFAYGPVRDENILVYELLCAGTAEEDRADDLPEDESGEI